MDILTLIGLLLGVLAIAGGQMLEGGSIFSLLQPTAAVIVFGGTIAAVLIQYPMSSVIQSIKMLRLAFFEQDENLNSTIKELINYAMIARREGLLALESRIRAIKEPFLKKGLYLVVDGADSNLIKEVMEVDAIYEEERSIVAAKVFESAGGYAPTIGIIGAILGLIQVMENLADPTRLGAGIAVAFVATIYGLASANIVWLPFAGKLKIKTRKDAVRKEMLIEGFVSIADGENPRYMEEKLDGFIAMKYRKKK
ncbi:MAG: flagellar motor protein [Deltaproteobacteria bacterium]|nr:flagellar motor protein [Deltaproteobacteria bacterium]